MKYSWIRTKNKVWININSVKRFFVFKETYEETYCVKALFEMEQYGEGMPDTSVIISFPTRKEAEEYLDKMMMNIINEGSHE